MNPHVVRKHDLEGILCLANHAIAFTPTISMLTKARTFWQALLNAYACMRNSWVAETRNGMTLTLARLASENERTSARSFCAEHSTRLGCGMLLEETFFGRNSGCFALLGGGKIYAVLEIQLLDDRPRAARVVHLAQLPILDGLPMLDAFVDLATRSFTSDAPEVTVQLGHEWRG